MSDTKLLEISPSSLSIACRLNVEIVSVITMVNWSDSHVAWKIKTNNRNNRYMMRPTNGVVEPRATAICRVFLMKMDAFPDPKLGKKALRDRFLIESFAVRPDEYDDADPSKLVALWKHKEGLNKRDPSRREFFQEQIKCQLVVPTPGGGNNGDAGGGSTVGSVAPSESVMSMSNGGGGGPDDGRKNSDVYSVDPHDTESVSSSARQQPPRAQSLPAPSQSSEGAAQETAAARSERSSSLNDDHSLAASDSLNLEMSRGPIGSNGGVDRGGSPSEAAGGAYSRENGRPYSATSQSNFSVDDQSQFSDDRDRYDAASDRDRPPSRLSQRDEENEPRQQQYNDGGDRSNAASPSLTSPRDGETPPPQGFPMPEPVSRRDANGKAMLHSRDSGVGGANDVASPAAAKDSRRDAAPSPAPHLEAMASMLSQPPPTASKDRGSGSGSGGVTYESPAAVGDRDAAGGDGGGSGSASVNIDLAAKRQGQYEQLLKYCDALTVDNTRLQHSMTELQNRNVQLQEKIVEVTSENDQLKQSFAERSTKFDKERRFARENGANDSELKEEDAGSILRRRANRSSDLPPQSAFASIPPLLDMHGQNGVEGVSTTQVFALVFVFFVGLLFGGILF